MDISNQVCSLDLSKRLKELGVDQESLFSWFSKEEDETEANAHAKMLIYLIENNLIPSTEEESSNQDIAANK